MSGVEIVFIAIVVITVFWCVLSWVRDKDYEKNNPMQCTHLFSIEVEIDENNKITKITNKKVDDD